MTHPLHWVFEDGVGLPRIVPESTEVVREQLRRARKREHRRMTRADLRALQEALGQEPEAKQ